MHYTTLGHNRLISNLKMLYRDSPMIEPVNYNEGINGLQKAEDLGLLNESFDEFEKGRKAMPIGSKATWGDTEYLKTANGWRTVGKNRGHVKSNHDFIHNNTEKDKDHHTMVMDAGKMSADEWAKKHGSALHGKYKEVHDYLHKEKVKKESEVKKRWDIILKDGSVFHTLNEKDRDDKIKMYKDKGYKFSVVEHEIDSKPPYDDKISRTEHDYTKHEEKDFPLPFEDGFEEAMEKLKDKKDHGIEVGKEYNHSHFGKVKVTKVEKNDGDKKNTISHYVTFKTNSGEETQGINGFKQGLKEHEKSGKTHLQEFLEKENSIPQKVKDKFKEISTSEGNFSFMNLHGRIWRRNNATGEITDHKSAPDVAMPKEGIKQVSEDFSFLKNMPEKQVEKYRDLAHQQLQHLGKELGMKESDVAKYPENRKRSYDQLNERIKQADQELMNRRNKPTFKPNKKEVTSFVTESLKQYNSSKPEEQKRLRGIVQDTVSRYESVLADKTDEDFNNGIYGMSLQKQKTMLEAGREFLKKIV